MSSAIELYKQAYDLDFKNGDRPMAEQLYKEIVERFPYSDEKEYALIHLDRIEKLKDNPRDPALQPAKTSQGLWGFAVLCFVLCLLLLVGCGLLGYFLRQQQKRIASNEYIIQGLIGEKAGALNAARLSYTQAQEIYPENVVACQCLAELYLANGKKELAEIEFKQWQLMSPDDANLKDFSARMSKD